MLVVCWWPLCSCIVLWCRLRDPFVLKVFRDVSHAQLNAALLYEMTRLMKDEAVERVKTLQQLYCFEVWRC